MSHTPSETDRLLDIIDTLRTHCAWTRALSHESLRSYLVEESYEVIDAIAAGQPEALRDELGDLLLQIVLHARIAEESGQFGFQDVARGLSEKMLRRNRHIFDAHGNLRQDITQDIAEIIEIWDAAKAAEGPRRGTRSGLPAGLPALTLAQKLRSRRRRSGQPLPEEHQPTAGPFDQVTDVASLQRMLLGLTARADELGLDCEAVLRDALGRAYAHDPDDTSSRRSGPTR